MLARTASGDVQPRAWLAACVAAAIRSGAGVILADASLPDASPAAAALGCPWTGGAFASREDGRCPAERSAGDSEPGGGC